MVYAPRVTRVGGDAAGGKYTTPCIHRDEEKFRGLAGHMRSCSEELRRTIPCTPPCPQYRFVAIQASLSQYIPSTGYVGAHHDTAPLFSALEAFYDSGSP